MLTATQPELSEQDYHFRIGDLDFNLIDRKVTKGERLLRLAPSEFQVLLYIALKRGEVITREELNDRLYGRGQVHVTNILDVHVSRLRKAIAGEEEGIDKDQFIAIARGQGWYLNLKFTDSLEN